MAPAGFNKPVTTFFLTTNGDRSARRPVIIYVHDKYHDAENERQP